MKAKRIITGILIVVIGLSVQTLYAQRHRPNNHNGNYFNQNNRKNKHKDITPHMKYKDMPIWGYSYNVNHHKSKNRVLAGSRYHYHNGIFYKPVGNNYVISKAPIGVRVRSVPTGHIRFVLGTSVYFYYYGTYYIHAPRSNEYITVAPPVGARVDALPRGYRKVYIEDLVYYSFEGTYYKVVVDRYGEVWFEVVGTLG